MQEKVFSRNVFVCISFDHDFVMVKNEQFLVYEYNNSNIEYSIFVLVYCLETDSWGHGFNNISLTGCSKHKSEIKKV